MAELPGSIQYCRIDMKLMRSQGDGSDPDRYPDGIPLEGASIVLTPSVPRAKVVTTDPPVTIAMNAIGGTTNSAGQLVSADGQLGVYVVASDSTDIEPSGFTYAVRITHASLQIPPFNIFAPANGEVDLTTAIPVPPNPGQAVEQWVQVVTRAEGAADRAEEAAARAEAPTEEKVYELIGTEGPVRSEVTGIVDSRAVTVKEAPLTPYRFGAVNPVAGSDNTEALSALFAAASQGATSYRGAEVYLPPGLWRSQHATPWNLVSNLVVRGAGIRTRLHVFGASSHMFTAPVTVQGVMFDKIMLSAAHDVDLFRISGSAGIHESTWRNCVFLVEGANSRIWNQDGPGVYIKNTFDDCTLTRKGNSTVSPFQIINSGGNANRNTFTNLRLDGGAVAGSHFFNIESTDPNTYCYDFTFRDLLGQVNNGGLIRGRSVADWLISNATDYDTVTPYQRPLVDIGPYSTLQSQNLVLSQVARRGGSLAAGVEDIRIGVSSGRTTIISCNPSPYSLNPVITAPASAVYVNVRGKPGDMQGTGTPVGNYDAPRGTLFRRTDGGAGTTLYIKEADGPTGWRAV